MIVNKPDEAQAIINSMDKRLDNYVIISINNC